MSFNIHHRALIHTSTLTISPDDVKQYHLMTSVWASLTSSTYCTDCVAPIDGCQPRTIYRCYLARWNRAVTICHNRCHKMSRWLPQYATINITVCHDGCNDYVNFGANHLEQFATYLYKMKRILRGMRQDGCCHVGCVPRWMCATLDVCHVGCVPRWMCATSDVCHVGCVPRWMCCHDG